MTTSFTLLLCVPNLIFAIVAARMASTRGRDGMAWFTLGLVFGPVAAYTLWRLPPGFRRR